jgi:hypothetical protein
LQHRRIGWRRRWASATAIGWSVQGRHGLKAAPRPWEAELLCTGRLLATPAYLNRCGKGIGYSVEVRRQRGLLCFGR